MTVIKVRHITAQITHHSQLPANFAHCDSTRKEYTRKPRPNVQKIWSSVPGNAYTITHVSISCHNEL